MTVITDEAVEAGQIAFRAWGYQGGNPKALRAALEAALPHIKGEQEPVAWVRSKFGDPEAFGEREIEADAKLVQKLPYNTPLFAHPSTELERLREERSTAIRRGEDQWAGWVKADCRVRELEAENERLRKALERQSDNIAFILNRVSIPDHWDKKFDSELEEDRAALSEAKR